MLFEEFTNPVSKLNIGDPVIITGAVEFQGKTGDVKSIGQDGSFVVVDLYNYGPQSFQASDVEYNDYADQEDVEEGKVQQLPTRGADYSKYDTDHLKMLLRPGILHRNEARFKALIRKELQKREQQGVTEMDKSAPQPGRDGRVSHSTYGSRDKGGSKGTERAARPITAKKAAQHALDILKKQGVAEQERVGNMPADQFDAAMARLKQLAGAGPLKTVWDPQKRVYRNVPTAVQPKK